MTNWLLLDLRRSNRGISKEDLEFKLVNTDREIARVRGLGAETGDEYLEVLKLVREAIVLELPAAASVPSRDNDEKTIQGKERTDKVMFGVVCEHLYVGTCPFCLFASAGRANALPEKEKG